MSPHIALQEIEMGMIRVGANDKFFKFKILTPLYPTMIGKLTDPEYWENEIWSQKIMVKKEREGITQNPVKLVQVKNKFFFLEIHQFIYWTGLSN